MREADNVGLSLFWVALLVFGCIAIFLLCG